MAHISHFKSWSIPSDKDCDNTTDDEENSSLDKGGSLLEKQNCQGGVEYLVKCQNKKAKFKQE